MPNGRLMVNCGGISEEPYVINGTVDPQNSSKDGTWAQNSTLKALSKAFAGQVGAVDSEIINVFYFRSCSDCLFSFYVMFVLLKISLQKFDSNSKH